MRDAEGAFGVAGVGGGLAAREDEEDASLPGMRVDSVCVAHVGDLLHLIVSSFSEC